MIYIYWKLFNYYKPFCIVKAILKQYLFIIKHIIVKITPLGVKPQQLWFVLNLIATNYFTSLRIVIWTIILLYIKRSFIIYYPQIHRYLI